MKKDTFRKRITSIGLAGVLLLSGIEWPMIHVAAEENADPLESYSEQYNMSGFYDIGYVAPSVNEVNGNAFNANADMMLLNATYIPASFDSRDYGYVTPVKNQGGLGICWAFAACAAMESYAITHGYATKDTIDLSEYAIASLTFDDTSYVDSWGDADEDKTYVDPSLGEFKITSTSGGNDNYVFKTLTKWAGIPSESVFTYNPATSEETTKYIYNQSQVDYVLTGQYYINMSDTDRVKSEIMENGAVTSYYNANYGAWNTYFYNYITTTSNHAITIVGWDDNFDKNKFTGLTNKPKNNGAWLIKNSWGNVGDANGYGWISYEDIALMNATACVYEIEPAGNYDYNYQHDGATVFGRTRWYQSTSFANVFTVKGSALQELKSVSFAVEDVNRTYSIQIYKNPTTSDPTSGTALLASPVTGRTTYAGYYTVKLPKDYYLSVGDKFAVVVTFNKDTYITTSLNMDYIGSFSKSSGQSATGETYVFIDGSYADVSEKYGTNGMNVTIKAFTSVANKFHASNILSFEDLTSTSVKISWQEVSGSEKYVLYRSDSVAGSPTKLYEGTATNYTDTGLVTDKLYYYYVVNQKTGQEDKKSAIEQYSAGTTPVATVEAVNKSDRIKISWEKTTKASKYLLYRWDGTNRVLLQTLSSTTSTYEDTTIEYGKTYTYSIKAVETSGGVDKSSIAVAAEPVKMIPLSPSYTIKGKVNICWESDISWDLVAGAEGYEIYREVYSSKAYISYPAYTLIKDTTETSYTDADFSNDDFGKYAYYYMRSYVIRNGVKIYSELSDITCVTILEPALSNVKWSVENNYISVSWDAYSGIKQYFSYMIAVFNSSEAESGTAYSPISTPKTRFYGLDYKTNYFIQVQTISNVGSVVYTLPQYPRIRVGGNINNFTVTAKNTRPADSDTAVLKADMCDEFKDFKVTYQWYKASTADGVGTAITGATSAEYSVSTSVKYYYYCIVTGTYNGTVTRTSNRVLVNKVVVTPKDIATCTISDIANQEYTGSAIEPELEIKNGELTLIKGVDYSAAYSNNVNLGLATVTISGQGNYYGTTTMNFTITEASASRFTIAAIANQEYTGNAIEPTVTVSFNGTTLVEDTDYSIDYSNNTNPGTATVTLTGKGKFTGTATKNFTIIAANASRFAVAAIADQEYTGSAIEPAVTVSFNGTTLTLGTDYSLSYSNNTNPGTATVSITGKGKYTGTTTKNFTITTASASKFTIAAISNQEYTGSAIEPAVTVSFNGTQLTKETDYTIGYSNNTNPGTATVTLTGIGKFTGSTTKNFTITTAQISRAQISDILSQEYTGKEIKPTPKLTYNGITLVSGTDYSVSYSENISIGTATVTITGKGNFTGTTTKNFTITPISATKFVVSNISSQEYTGSEIKPNVTVSYNGKSLSNGADYTVSYSNNVNAGTATVIIAGKGIYGGSCSKTFSITPTSIAAASINSIPSYEYTGSAIKPTVTVTYNGKTLVNGTDYTVTYSNNVNVGTATATITGKGNYTGSKSSNFTITKPSVPNQITSSTVTVNGSSNTVSKISTGTSVDELKNKLNEKQYITIFNASGQAVSGSAKVATGMKVSLMDGGTVKKTYYTVVTGDVNGDGVINITDMLKVKSVLLSKDTVTGVYQEASDVNGDGKVNITDFLKIKATLLKKDSITPR